MVCECRKGMFYIGSVTWCHVIVNTGVNSPWMLYITDGVDVFDGGVYLIKCLPETIAGTGTSITK